MSDHRESRWEIRQKGSTMDTRGNTGIDQILKEAEMIWPQVDLGLNVRDERETVRSSAVSSCTGEFANDYADACECFYLFRIIHRMSEKDPAFAALTGDYFFSRFSHALIPVDSVPLIERFSDYLKADAKQSEKAFDLTEYLAFIRHTAKEIAL